MEFIKKNILIIGLILIVAVGIGGFIFWKSSQQAKTPTSKSEEMQNAKEMKPEEIGLELSLRSDKKAVTLRATKLTGVKSLEYELTYDAQVSEDGDTATVPRGAVGELKINNGTATAEVDLGTCSANVCKYDKVVSDIKVVIKVNLDNGEVGAVESTISY